MFHTDDILVEGHDAIGADGTGKPSLRTLIVADASGAQITVNIKKSEQLEET